jgi:ADP-ribosylglycohydrolase
LDRTLDEIRPTYVFDVTCQGSVPEAIIAFLESNDFEDCIRKAISIGGDTDTIAAMAGGIAEAFYGSVPTHIYDEVLSHLPEEMIKVLSDFAERVRIHCE